MRNSAIILSLFLAACTAVSPVVTKPPLPPTEPPVPVSVTTQDAPEQARVITVRVTNFSFSEDVIHMKKGERVVLAFTGVEGVHGVMIEGLGIDVAVPPGETVQVAVPTDTAGTFSFFCSIPCGPGHSAMRGTIVIE